MQNIIYHITTKQEWQTAIEKDFYEAVSLAKEGFIHCSTEQQVAGVIQRYFAGKTDLIKLTIDASKLHAKLQFDFSPSGQQDFPHIYGSINPDAVIHTSLV